MLGEFGLTTWVSILIGIVAGILIVRYFYKR